MTGYWLGRVILSCVSLLLLSSSTSLAATYRQIDVPESTSTVIYGINSAGQMVGQYSTATGGAGFVFSNGKFTNINYPGTTSDTASGINDHGDIVGYYYTNALHSFLYHNGRFISIVFPGATSTQVNGINNLGDMVGGYVDQAGLWHGFLLHQGQFTSIEVTGADYVSALGVNDKGFVVGYFHTYCDESCDITENFFFYGDQVHEGSLETATYGINNLNEVVGDCNVGRGQAFIGCLLTSNSTLYWNYPGMYWTEPNAINDQGVIVGEIEDFSLDKHGFVLRP